MFSRVVTGCLIYLGCGTRVRQGILIEVGNSSARLSGCAERIILAPMSALLLPVQEGDIWRVQIVWPNRHVNYFGIFTSERDATAWINAHSNLTKPEDTIDEPQIDL